MPADYATIQDALNVSGVGDTVLVGPGTYSDYTIVNLDAVVASVPDGVSVISEAGPEQTIIDLALLDGIGQVAFDVGNHASGLTVIDGFRVINPPPHTTEIGVGGAIFVDIRNCVFEGVGPPDPGVIRHGIGASFSSLRVTNCTFIQCSAGIGSAINVNDGSLVVESCEFIECANQAIRVAKDLGAGPYSLEVRDSVFDHVSAIPSSPAIGGGCILTNLLTGPMTVDGCVFNSPVLKGVGSEGAAIAFYSAGVKTITNNVFYGIDLSLYNSSCIRALLGTLVVSGNTFHGIHQDPQTVWGGSVLWGQQLSSLMFERNIVSQTSGTPALIWDGPSIVSDCNVFWDNAEGPGYTLSPTDRIADPQFCDPENGDFTLQGTSPCLPALSLGCGQIGALGQGCGAVSVTRETWGKIKSAFRTGEEVAP